MFDGKSWKYVNSFLLSSCVNYTYSWWMQMLLNPACKWYLGFDGFTDSLDSIPPQNYILHTQNSQINSKFLECNQNYHTYKRQGNYTGIYIEEKNLSALIQMLALVDKDIKSVITVILKFKSQTETQKKLFRNPNWIFKEYKYSA